MGSSPVDLDKHSLALLAAKSDVVSGRAAASWALFAYEKSNELKLLDSGGGGPDELAKRFQSGRIMYGLCRLSESAAGTPRIVLIHWVGEKVLDSQQEACAGHLPAIRAFFKVAHLVLKASRAEEVTREGLTWRLSLAAPPGAVFSKKGVGSDPQELVGTNYQKTNPLLEILHTKRSSFWAQAEREEEQRREEERRRAQEERRRWEHLRMEEERREAAERERRVQEKEKLIQEQRKQQAQRDAEEHRWEEARRKEQAKAISGTSLQSQASEKARAVAVPGSQQPHTPRGFFQKRGRLGSASGDPGPGMPRRPFLRYQRSLTESAYIFRRPDPDLSGSFQASVPHLAPSIGPKSSALTPVPERRLPGTGSLPEPALPPTSSPPVPAPCETEAVPPCSTPCLAPPALTCALNGAEAESASPPQSPQLAPSPENASESPWGQGSQCSVVLGPCCPLAAPYEEALPPSHAPEGQVSPSPAPGASGGAMDWEELPSSRANSPPSTHPGETVPAKGGSAGVAPGQAGSILPSVRNGTEEERWRGGQVVYLHSVFLICFSSQRFT
ncbi:uncharacterized protein PHA67_022969 isoform 2-T3 [Liasis olivaceus]